jgi:acyl-CoA oxidase
VEGVRQDEARAHYAALRASGDAPVDEKTLKAKKR